MPSIGNMEHPSPEPGTAQQQDRGIPARDGLHLFDNGVRVFKRHLLPYHFKRYASVNLHEPEQEAWFRKVMPLLKAEPAPVFVDAGSGIGYYSILLEMNVPQCRVICYEPLALHRVYLAENWELNGLNPEHLVVKSEALYSRSGRVPFKKQRFGSRILRRKLGLKDRLKRLLSSPVGRSANAVPLDDEIPAYGRIDLLKLDVEGAEIEVLKGASSSLRDQRIKVLIISTHNPGIHRECLALLTSSGYEIAFEKLETTLQPDGIVVAAARDVAERLS